MYRALVRCCQVLLRGLLVSVLMVWWFSFSFLVKDLFGKIPPLLAELLGERTHLLICTLVQARYSRARCGSIPEGAQTGLSIPSCCGQDTDCLSGRLGTGPKVCQTCQGRRFWSGSLFPAVALSALAV